MNKLYKLCLICALCIVLLPVLPVSAKINTSDANISFIDDEESGGNGGGGGGGGGGSHKLVLTSVPDIDFGIQAQIPRQTVRYSAKAVDGALMVSDRRATGAGWNVTASLSNFHTEDGRISLSGAYLTLLCGEVAPMSGQYVNPPYLTSNALRLDAGGGTKIVFRADRGQGYGQWYADWQAEHAGLTVLADTARAGDHSATLTWTLEDAPG